MIKEKVSNLHDLIFLDKKNFVFDLVRKEPIDKLRKPWIRYTFLVFLDAVVFLA